MALPVAVTFGKRSYYLQFTANALRRLEKETGLSIHQLSFILTTGSGEFGQMQALVWAGLEGARIRDHNKRNLPFTIDEVGDLLDEEGGPGFIWHDLEHPISKAVIEAWQSAFPKKRAPEPGDTPDDKEGTTDPPDAAS
jgi:hypothetical protein